MHHDLERSSMVSSFANSQRRRRLAGVFSAFETTKDRRREAGATETAAFIHLNVLAHK
jgi:hypothetical protein